MNQLEREEKEHKKRADDLHNTAVDLFSAGDLSNAKDAAAQAIEIFTALVGRVQEKYEPDLANALSLYSILLYELGERSLGIEMAKKAVDIEVILCKRNRKEYQPRLARSLSNLAMHYSMLGDRSKAISLASEAAVNFEELVKLDSESYLPMLAASVHNLAVSEIGEGYVERATADANKATAYYRKLVSVDREQYLPHLAICLLTLSTCHSREKNEALALACATEAAALYEELVISNRRAHLPRLGGVLSNLASRLLASGEMEESLSTARRAVEIRKELVSINKKAYLHELAFGLHTLMNCLLAMGATSEASQIAMQISECMEDEDTHHMSEWTEQVAELSLRYLASNDLPADIFFPRYLQLLLDRVDLGVRDAYIHELEAFNTFCSRYLEFTRLQMRRGRIDQVQAASDSLSNLVSAIQSRDIRAVLMKEPEFSADENTNAYKLAKIRKEIVGKSIFRDSLIEQSESSTGDTRLQIGEEIGEIESALDLLRSQFKGALSEIAQSDRAFAASRLDQLSVQQLKSILNRLTKPKRTSSSVARKSGLLCFLDLPDVDGTYSIRAVWLSEGDDHLRILFFPEMRRLAEQFEKHKPLESSRLSFRYGEFGRTTKEDGSLNEPRTTIWAELEHLESVLLDSFRSNGIDSSELESLVVCTHGLSHSLPFGALNIFAGIRLLLYPGLPFAFAAAERVDETLVPSATSDRWLLASNAALDTEHPIPTTILERELSRQILCGPPKDSTATTHFNVEPGTSGRYVHSQAISGANFFGLVALCHGQHSSAHDSQLDLEGQSIRASDVLSWENPPKVALLPVCLVGRTRDDRRGNAMGIVSALMLKGCEVVIGFTQPVIDSLSPWLTSLILWHMRENSLDAWSAAHLSRIQFSKQAWPEAYRKDVAAILVGAIPLILKGGTSSPTGALALEEVRRHSSMSESDIFNRLGRIARGWPWEGYVELEQLMISPDDCRNERLSAIADGLFTVRSDQRMFLSEAFREQAAFMHILGRPN